MSRFVIQKAKNGQFYFNLKAKNGQVILTSEMYKTKAAAQNGIESVRKNASNDGRFDRKATTKGQPFFALKAANNEPIGRSETYTTKSAMEKGVASVKKNASGATVEDLS